MALSTSSGAPILRPEQIHDLIVRPVTEESVALRVSTVVTTTSKDYRVPVVATDPTASWVAEGAEIVVTDPTLTEVTVVPSKVAGLTVISRELANDSSPAAAETVGRGLARDIAKRIDEAFFGSVAAPAPSGLGALAGTTAIITPAGETAWADLDVFAAAQSEAEQEGAEIGTFVAAPGDALALAQLKDESGSSRPLLGVDPAQPTRRLLFGVPLLVSPYVTAGTIWGLPRDRVIVVVREDATIDVSTDSHFTSDRVAIKATMRVGFAFAHPAAVAEISLATV